MEQRPLRLGDIVDDYCPRERRITNHAIVAIVEDAIRQTRCATCEAEHVYKQGREPLRRRKDAPASVLVEDGSAPLVPDPIPAPLVEASSPADEPMAAQGPEPRAESPEPNAEAPPHDDHWPAHRQLIRASLPKTENDVPVPRPIPEFTMYQRPVARGGGFRFRQGRPGGGSGDGNVAGRGDFNGRGGHGNGNPNGNVNGNGDGNRAGQGRSRRRRGHGKRTG